MAEKEKGVSFGDLPEQDEAAKKKFKKQTKAAEVDNSIEDVDVEIDSLRESTVGPCRMYEQKYPEVDDLVVVEVKSIEEMGAYVALKEYNDIEGMILLSELSRRRIRSINKIIRVGRLEVVLVLRVDKEKGYIDLSKRRVSDEDVVKAEEKYNKSKMVHSIMRHVAETAQKEGLPDCSFEEVFSKVGWPLSRKYGHAYDAFKLSMGDPNILPDLHLEPKLLEIVQKNIRRRMTPQPVKVRTDLEVTCFHYEGIDAIKQSLKKGEETTTAEAPISVKLVAPPLYVVVTTSINKDIGLKALNVAIEAIRTEILKFKGELVVKVAPRTVHERDDKELEKYMEKLQRENEEVPGDDSGEEGEEGEEAED